jgi:hypothetical protein
MMKLLSCKVIDLCQRLENFGEVRTEEHKKIDQCWAGKVCELFEDISQTEQKVKNANRHYHKAISPMIKYLSQNQTIDEAHV